ncbi:MAG TPA: response regulator [Flavisolibacter sp.]|nr:response regulator [Flavisolibacter sp.]
MEIQSSVENGYKRPVKILAVDDREDNLFSIETILEQEDYTVIKATSGRSALKILLTQQDFTLILMDVQMPDMNGFETASLIYEREKLRHIPIIFITAHNQGEEKMYEGYKMGGVDFIYKPINPELLRFKVSVFVELYQKTHQLIDHEKNLVAANKKLEKEIEERRVSEEKISLLNQQLVLNNQQLQNTIEELDRFAYVASHDLQEPLRKILVFSDKIQTKYSKVVDEEMDRNLSKIVKASERMQLLINDLLRFSRNSSNSEDFSAINLVDLISEVLIDMEVDIERHSAQVKIDNLPQIWGISSQMRQLFQNLVSNSLKFRKKELAPAIHIYSEPKVLVNGKEMELGRIVIQDNGIGFDPKFAKDIFTVFKRLHSYHEFEGSGVGLSICKKIVERHKGNITAASEIGVGAKFIIDLPVASADLVNSSRIEKVKS